MSWTDAAVAVSVFAVYAAGACPTIYVGDSGELVTAVHVLGIPHPTGYPLYVLLGKLWTLLLPVGSIAWRMSLFSAACGALAAALLHRACRLGGLHPIAALTAAGSFAFAPSVWSEANVQRVYALAAVFVVGAAGSAWRWYRTGGERGLVVAFLLCGLGAGAHTVLAVEAAAIAGFALATRPAAALRPRLVARAAAAFALGLLPYLYLPIRSRMDPVLDWGDPETPGAFLAVVLRRSFWDRAWLERPADLLVVLGDWLGSVGWELCWGGAALAALGLVAGRRRGWPVLLPLLIMMGNVLALALHGSRTDLFVWHRYYIPSYAMAAWLAGLGAQLVVERLPRALRPLPLLVPAALLVGGWSLADRSRYRIADEFSRAVLASLPPGAHLAATDDNVLFALMYLQFVEERRPDVDLILQGVGGAALPPLRFDPDADPLFFTHHPNWQLVNLDVVPVGLVFQVRRAGQPLPPPVVPIDTLPGEDDPRVPKDHLTQNLIGQFHFMIGFTFEERDWPRARRELARAAAAAPDNDVLFYNLGLLYWRNGLWEEAAQAFARSAAINPRHLASGTRPRAADRLAEVERERARIARLRDGLLAEPALRALPPGGGAWHRALAERLAAAGEVVAARGERLRALEAGAPSP